MPTDSINLRHKKKTVRSIFYFRKKRWRPILTAEDVIISVISMILDPNCDSPANIDASVLIFFINGRFNLEIIDKHIKKKLSN